MAVLLPAGIMAVAVVVILTGEPSCPEIQWTDPDGMTVTEEVCWTAGEATGWAGYEGFEAPVSGAVPEPGTWAVMVLGFGLAGWGLRRRLRPVGVASALQGAVGDHLALDAESPRLVLDGVDFRHPLALLIGQPGPPAGLSLLVGHDVVSHEKIDRASENSHCASHCNVVRMSQTNGDDQ